jgi:hypothetical protein
VSLTTDNDARFDLRTSSTQHDGASCVWQIAHFATTALADGAIDTRLRR